MSYKLQIKRRHDKDFRTIKESDEPRNIVVQYLAYQHNGKGYPLLRVRGDAGVHLETKLNAPEYSDKYLDRLVAQIYELVASVNAQRKS